MLQSDVAPAMPEWEFGQELVKIVKPKHKRRASAKQTATKFEP
jgi:hypothetical protein